MHKMLIKLNSQAPPVDLLRHRISVKVEVEGDVVQRFTAELSDNDPMVTSSSVSLSCFTVACTGISDFSVKSFTFIIKLQFLT